MHVLDIFFQRLGHVIVKEGFIGINSGILLTFHKFYRQLFSTQRLCRSGYRRYRRRIHFFLRSILLLLLIVVALVGGRDSRHLVGRILFGRHTFGVFEVSRSRMGGVSVLFLAERQGGLPPSEEIHFFQQGQACLPTF